MIRLIIFDLDGTLIDSIPDLTDATNYMRSRFSLSSLSQQEVREFVGEGARRLVEKALPGFTSEQLKYGLDCFLDFNFSHIADKTILYPEVPETLAILKQHRYTLALASNKSESHCREIMRILQIDHHFDAILGADSLPERKPSPAPLLHLMQKFSSLPQETIMVGDSINDIAAGKSAGVFTVGCTYGYGHSDELKNADARISTLSLLHSYLNPAT